MYDLFTIHIWMAIFGGAVGGINALYDSAGAKRPVGAIITDFLISIIAAVSFTSYVFRSDDISPFVYLGVGAFAGASARMVMGISKKSLGVFIKAKFGSMLSFFASWMAKEIAKSQQKAEKDNKDEI